MFRLKPPVSADKLLFSGTDLRRLLVPLVFEQLLMMLVGVVNTAMVSRVGEAAVSGVSLVDMINQLIIQVLEALATGGAVIASQYIGHREPKKSCETANQLLIIVTAISLMIMAVFFVLKYPILRALFGDVDDNVMNSALTYLVISAVSYPFLGLYSAGAALFRAMKRTNITLWMAGLMNVVNMALSAVFIFRLDMGVAGAAFGSLIGRMSAGVIICLLLLNKKRLIYFIKPVKPFLDLGLIKKILYIGIPNGVENGIFQFGRILVVSIISGFGTVQIAANAVANNIAGMETIPGFAVGIGMITVIGQCVGAGDYGQAEYFTRKMNRLAGLLMFVYNGIILLLLAKILNIYQLTPETLHLAMILLIIHGGFGMIFWVPSFVMPNALRASNDVKFTMTVSIVSMWVFRILFSIILGRIFGWGVIGVWSAMILDWLFRGALFRLRFRSRKWQRIKLI